jgi:hypothetical protein
MKYAARLLFGAVLLLTSISVMAEQIGPKQDTDAGRLKKYVFSQCIAKIYPENSADAKKASAGYLEFGKVNDADSYLDAQALMEKWINRDYPSISGTQIQLMKCIDLYRSQELDAFAKTKTSKPIKK